MTESSKDVTSRGSMGLLTELPFPYSLDAKGYYSPASLKQRVADLALVLAVPTLAAAHASRFPINRSLLRMLLWGDAVGCALYIPVTRYMNGGKFGSDAAGRVMFSGGAFFGLGTTLLMRNSMYAWATTAAFLAAHEFNSYATYREKLEIRAEQIADVEVRVRELKEE